MSGSARARNPRSSALSVELQSARKIGSKGGHCRISIAFDYQDDGRTEQEWNETLRLDAGRLARVAAAAEPFIHAERTRHGCERTLGRVQVQGMGNPLQSPSLVEVDSFDGPDICDLDCFSLLVGFGEAGLSLTIPDTELEAWSARVSAWLGIIGSE